MRPATARYASFYATAWVGAALVRAAEYPFWVGTLIILIPSVVLAASVRVGWPEPVQPVDDSPLPPELLDLGDKVGRS